MSQRAFQRRTAMILLVLALLSLLTVSATPVQEAAIVSAPMGEIGDQPQVTDVLSDDELPCPPTAARLLCPNTG